MVRVPGCALASEQRLIGLGPSFRPGTLAIIGMTIPGMNTSLECCSKVAIVLLLLVWSLTPARAQHHDWDVAVLDELLAAVQPKQRLVQLGDMEVLVSRLTACRDWLAGVSPTKSAFDGVAPLWTGGNIYYTFDASVSAAKQKAFLDGAAEWAMFANVRFIPRTAQANYMTVKENPALGGGLSALGMVGGQQFLQIGPSSWNRATIVHELGHTLGMVHEQQRSDRDSFIVVLTSNIAAGQEGNFVKLANSRNLGAYDFLSVMHYSRNSFSINPTTLNTMQPLAAYAQFLNVMGQKFDPVLSTADRAGMVTSYGAGPMLGPIVTNTLDCGPGSLRAALYYAFDHAGTTITFNIPTTDAGFSNSVFNIVPTDAFPSLVNATILDGSSEPTNSNVNGPEILISGALAQPPSLYASGLRLTGTNCTVHSLIVNGFSSSGILIDGTNAVGNVVSGCYVGVNASGTAAVTNSLSPITISNGARSNTVGGTTVAARNVISGSFYQGLVIRDPGTKNNVVQGNYIGLNATGTAQLSNRWSGVAISSGAQSNTVGGLATGARNIIAGNGNQGVLVADASTTGNAIVGNFIGLNAAGTAAIANKWSGVNVFGGASGNTIGGTAAAAGNVISGNGNQAVAISGTGTRNNLVQGNLLGLNAAGTAALSNGWSGVAIFGGAQSNLVGGTVPAARNIISGNGNQGVLIAQPNTAGNVIAGNFIGVNHGGTGALPNGWAGIAIYSGATSNVIGGTTTGARNVISGNGNQGVLIVDATTRGNSVMGNFIGLNAAGTAALSNNWSGIELFGGTQGNVIGGLGDARNFISGNGDYGILITDNGTAGNLLYGNTIGLNGTDGAALPNGAAGIILYGGAQSNQIGGLAIGTANRIAGNLSDGVELFDADTTSNPIRGNSIFSNGGVGVALFSGGNGNAAAPSLTSATLTTNTTVSGSLVSLASTTFHLDFYASPAPVAGAEGMTYLGARDVTTSGGGTVNFTTSVGALVPAGRIITATATDPAGNTSRFSAGVVVTVASGVNDGVPNTWRALYFGGGGTTTNGQSCATCDPDGDGMDNRSEFLAGTNPTNSTSRVTLRAVPPNAFGNVATLLSSTGIVYRVGARDDFSGAAWSILADQVIGTGGNIPLIDPASTAKQQRFYRAEVLW
jgi:hypothetical protein